MSRPRSFWLISLGALLLLTVACSPQTAPRQPEPGTGSSTDTPHGDDDDSTTTPDDDDTAPLPGQGAACRASDHACAEGLGYIEYYGIAGPRGPLFTSCEIACSDGGACPDGQQCVTIADGPGQVCRAP